MPKKEAPKYYPNMSRDDLIGYCELHCETPRALFNKAQIAQMIEYAGNPEEYMSPEELMNSHKEWYSLHETMEKLVELAREQKE